MQCPVPSVRVPCRLPLHVAPPHARDYERIALAVRDQTIALYREHLQRQRVVDPTVWKLTKQREHVHAYVARAKHTAPTAFHTHVDHDVASPEILTASDWVPHVKFQLVGQLVGSVDDALFGLAAPTELAMFMRSVSLGDDLIDHKNLLEIRLPTSDAPFTYTGLKWSLRSSSMASLVKARDVTYVEATGFTRLRLASGEDERVGFLVQHSLTLPQLPPLDAQGVVRAQLSTCTLLRTVSPTVVEVFSTTALCPGGDLPTKVATRQILDALLAVSKASDSALKKKLVWMQAARRPGAPRALVDTLPVLIPLYDATFTARRRSFSESPHPATCGHCTRSLSKLRTVTTCEICETPVCARCVASHKLVFGVNRRDTRVKSLAVCSGCLATARAADNTRALAAIEFAAPFDRLRAKSAASTAGVASSHARRRLASDSSTVVSSGASSASSSGARRRSSAAARGIQSITSVGRSDKHEHRLERGAVVTADHDSDELCHDTTQPLPRLPSSHDTASDFAHTDPGARHHLPLWQQMNELCLQAELTYHQARQHAPTQRNQQFHPESEYP